MDANPIPATADPRLWRRHQINRQSAAMAMDPKLDPKMAKAMTMPQTLAAARLRFPIEYSRIAQALGAPVA